MPLLRLRRVLGKFEIPGQRCPSGWSWPLRESRLAPRPKTKWYLAECSRRFAAFSWKTGTALPDSAGNPALWRFAAPWPWSWDSRQGYRAKPGEQFLWRCRAPCRYPKESRDVCPFIQLAPAGRFAPEEVCCERPPFWGQEWPTAAIGN